MQLLVVHRETWENSESEAEPRSAWVQSEHLQFHSIRRSRHHACGSQHDIHVGTSW